MTGSHRPDRRKERTTLAWFVLGTLPFVLLVAWNWHYGPIAALGDWAQYMLHADALLHGRSYGDIGYIFTNRNPFIGPPTQPPGLPAVLVPLLALTDGAREASVYKMLMVAFALAFLGGALAYFTRHAGPMVAAATVMLTGLWLEAGFVTNAVQPDVGFCAFVWGILYLVDRDRPWRWRDAIIVSVLGIAALAFRVAALPLVPAVAVYAWMHRRENGARAFIPVVVWGVCGLVAAVAIPGALTFGRLIVSDPARLVHNVAEAARVYPFATLDLFLYPFPWNRANDVYHIVFAAMAVVGGLSWLRASSTRLLTLFAVFYLGMLFVLPAQDGRYLMPLAPLVLYAGVTGTAMTVRWLARRLGRELRVSADGRTALAAGVLISATTLGFQTVKPQPTVLLDAPGVSGVFETLRSAHQVAPVRAVFMNPRVLTWTTGVPAMGFFLAEPDTTLAEFRARHITHVVVGDLATDPLRAPSIERAVAERPDAFRRVFAEGVFTVYAFDSMRVARP